MHKAKITVRKIELKPRWLAQWIYLDHKYDAERVSLGGIYEFDSKEKYTEFMLTWF